MPWLDDAAQSAYERAREARLRRIEAEVRPRLRHVNPQMTDEELDILVRDVAEIQMRDVDLHRGFRPRL